MFPRALPFVLFAASPAVALNYDQVYDPARVLEVEVDMQARDWDQMRFQSRSLRDAIGPGCTTRPASKPYDWFAADVTVDGIAKQGVGIRIKGFIGSINPERPSLKLKFDEFVPGGRLGDDIERLTLNNSTQDPSRVRTCLTFETFRNLGLPAPRCSFAHVTVNGHDLGVYVNVEPIKSRFLETHYDDDTGVLIEGNLSDFTFELLRTFDRKNSAANGPMIGLTAVVHALQQDDDALIEALDAEVDLEQFYRFWVAEIVTAQWDGYTGNRNNFMVYQDPAQDRFVFLPWGPDSTWGLQEIVIQQEGALWANGEVARRLAAHPEGRKRFTRALGDALDTFSESDLLHELDRIEEMLEPFLLDEGRPLYDEHIAEVRGFIAFRREPLHRIHKDLPKWPHGIPEALCLEDGGEVFMHFDTAWGSNDEPRARYLVQGGGRVDGTVENRRVHNGTAAVIGPGTQPKTQLMAELVALPLPGGNAWNGFIGVVSPDLVKSGQRIELGDASTLGIVIEVVPPDNQRLIGFVVDGEMRFEQGSTEWGEAVKGSIDGNLLVPTGTLTDFDEDARETVCRCARSPETKPPLAAIWGAALALSVRGRHRRRRPRPTASA